MKKTDVITIINKHRKVFNESRRMKSDLVKYDNDVANEIIKFKNKGAKNG